MHEVGIGLIGAGFISALHAEAFQLVPEAHLRGMRARGGDGGERAAASPRATPSPRPHRLPRLLARSRHRHPGRAQRPPPRAIVAAAAAGKHVICEKPLCLTLEEADAMIDACAQRRRACCMYAEELCFAPKYVRAKQLVDEGALGRVYLVKQGEKHAGPHADWFWDVERSGGGVLMDMGCHGIAFCRWVLGKPAGRRASTRQHGHLRPRRQDAGRGPRRSAIIEFEGGAIGRGREQLGQARRHGRPRRDLRLEGPDLRRPAAAATRCPPTARWATATPSRRRRRPRGWTFTDVRGAWNYGFPQEMRHFVDCVQHDREPLKTGEDGRAVLEIIYGWYLSAGSAGRVACRFDADARGGGRQPGRRLMDAATMEGARR